MGINVEFNPDLALRVHFEFKKGRRKREECLPEKLVKDGVYPFLKEGQRNYWLEGVIPLLETKGKQNLSKPLAAIAILEATHFYKAERLWTAGRYIVLEVFDPNDNTVHFEGFKYIMKEQ